MMDQSPGFAPITDQCFKQSRERLRDRREKKGIQREKEWEIEKAK